MCFTFFLSTFLTNEFKLIFFVNVAFCSLFFYIFNDFCIVRMKETELEKIRHQVEQLQSGTDSKVDR